MKRGFTLIETIIYIALYAIIIVGAFSAAYEMVESSARNERIAMVEEEGDFLVGKIDWALGNAASIQLPASSGSILSLTPADGSTITFRTSGISMTIETGASPQRTLNNADVAITNLHFVHTLPTSDGINPESISASFTVYATTTDGHLLSRDFSILKYLRK